MQTELLNRAGEALDMARATEVKDYIRESLQYSLNYALSPIQKNFKLLSLENCLDMFKSVGYDAACLCMIRKYYKEHCEYSFSELCDLCYYTIQFAVLVDIKKVEE